MQTGTWISMLSLFVIQMINVAALPNQQQGNSGVTLIDILNRLDRMEVKMNRMYKMVKRLKNKSKTFSTRRKKKYKQNNAFRYITGGDSELYTTGASLPTAAVWSTSETPLLSTVITPLSTPDKPKTTTTTAASAEYSAERISMSGTDPNSKIVYKRRATGCTNGVLSYDEVKNLGAAVKRQVYVWRNRKKCVYRP